MGNTPTLGRRVGVGVAGFATAAAVAVFAAPPAHATVDSITISGSDHVIDTTYTLRAQLSGAGIGLLVYWTANGESIANPQVPWPVGESSVPWTPREAGQHLITAAQGGSTKTIVVNVTDPNDPGPGDPGDPDPGDPGSPGTGSAGNLLRGLFGGSSR
ncbi:hypothetical protein [Nocardia puris]|uniref:Ig-like domain-containing protein n=1 Tax=Nocardia puris TaxID=208602 RepID=A0A366DKW6_9NOCA|nr:hypothetical protein [Nocardia puris]RBO90723.1 hypothetical protein DFR74_105125 [Nocardia puris]